MDQADVNSAALSKKSSADKVVRHTNSDTVENVDKMTIRTKNGLVNGVTEEKSKSSKNKAKSNNTNVTKEPKKSKKGHTSGVHNNVVDVSNSNNHKKSKSGQKNSKIESSNPKNCVTDINISEESSSLSTNNNFSPKEDCNLEISQLKSNQSEIKPIEPGNKGESKRKKNKSKVKVEQNVDVDQSNCNLPKFDITSIINSTVSNENLLSKMSDGASTSQLTASNPHLLEYHDSSSEFEKDLIESIKNLKIQQDTIAVDAQDMNPTELEEHSNNLDSVRQEDSLCDIEYVQYESELQMPMIMKIIQKDLSEPYSIYTYRYFIHNWPKLCFLAMCERKCVGAIVCKLDFHRKSTKRGYIAMLAVDKDYRKRRIGSTLVRRAIKQMIAGGADEVVLETEVTNKPALRLYEQLGFVRDKRLFRYYLNGVDALRLKLWLR